MTVWDWITVGIVAGFSSFFSELAKDLKKFLARKIRLSHSKIKQVIGGKLRDAESD